MKIFFVSLTLVLTLVRVSLAASDEKYTHAMEATLAQMNSSKTLADMQQAANQFEMISKANTAEWLPVYYAAFCYATMSYMDKNSDKRDLYVTQAEKLLETLTSENDEIYVLRAYVAQANMAVDGQNRWQKQGAIFQENIEKAEKLNPENPRIDYLKGTGLFYTPEAFGGGAKAACPILQRAKAKYAVFKTASSIAPDWGKPYLEMLLQKCS